MRNGKIRLTNEQWFVWNALRRIQPATDQEVADFLGVKDVRSWRDELVRKGLVVETGARRCKVTRKKAITWRTATK